jgi:hypothetical protein
MRRATSRSTVSTMDVSSAPPVIGGDAVYMVEVYRPAGVALAVDHPSRLPAPSAGPTVLAVIDVPGDEVALFVIAAPDAASAERVARDRGMRPIRVVPVQWDAASDKQLVRDSPDVTARS